MIWILQICLYLYIYTQIIPKHIPLPTVGTGYTCYACHLEIIFKEIDILKPDRVPFLSIDKRELTNNLKKIETLVC